MAEDLGHAAIGKLTDLRASQGEDWLVAGDEYSAHATLRRIGWLDQRGRVWTELPSGGAAAELACGSFTPLLIDVRGDD